LYIFIFETYFLFIIIPVIADITSQLILTQVVDQAPAAMVPAQLVKWSRRSLPTCAQRLKQNGPEDKAKHRRQIAYDFAGLPDRSRLSNPGYPGLQQQPVEVRSQLIGFQQYLYYWQNLLRGDLGVSSSRRMQVVDVLTELAPRTLILILPGAIIGFILGLRLGIAIAWKRGGVQEMGSTVAGVSLFTAFPPFLGFLLAQFLHSSSLVAARESSIPIYG
jgi:ABC-type dipeptide/oligopeptide/nickel transport system permease component